MDTYSYKGWLNSDSFLKRAFAILGYNSVASLIIAIPFYIIMFALILTIFSGARSDARDTSERMRAAQEEMQATIDADQKQVELNAKTK